MSLSEAKLGHLSVVFLFFCLFFVGLVFGVPPSKPAGVSLRIVDVAADAIITVEVTNTSKSTVRMWDDWNSWGAAHWRVLRIRDGKIITLYQDPDQLFTKNGPTFHELLAGHHEQKLLSVNEGNWCDAKACSLGVERGIAGEHISFEPNDLVVVVLDVPVQDGTRENKIWYGVAAATTTFKR